MDLHLHDEKRLNLCAPRPTPTSGFVLLSAVAAAAAAAAGGFQRPPVNHPQPAAGKQAALGGEAATRFPAGMPGHSLTTATKRTGEGGEAGCWGEGGVLGGGQDNKERKRE